MVRSILSVITGIVMWGVLWAGAGIGLAKAMPDRFNDQGGTMDPIILGVLIAYSVVLSLLAGFLCATIARRVMMRHVMILAIIQLLIGIAVQAGVWDAMPIWYHLIFLALVIPGHVAGGAMRASKSTT